MKVKVVRPGIRGRELLSGDELTVEWSVDGSELTVSGWPDDVDEDGLMSGALKKERVDVLADSELTRLKWRGRIVDVGFGRARWRRTCTLRVSIEREKGRAGSKPVD